MKKLGVVVGRFQTPYLHEGHKHLIGTALAESDEVILFIGIKYINRTGVNPLTFEERYKMVKYYYPTDRLHMYGIADNPSDKEWSRILDMLIEAHDPNYDLEKEYKVTLYGSRDSFINSYHGRFTTKELPAINAPSATHIRKGITSFDQPYVRVFYEGIVKGATMPFPHVYSVVDVAVLKNAYEAKQLSDIEVLLGRRKNETGWRFPGGFVDVNDESFEIAARREVLEECGDLEISPMTYISNVKCDDYRYRSEKDKMFTTFYRTDYIYGRPIAGDDLYEVKWFKMTGDTALIMIPGHNKLYNKLIDFEQTRLLEKANG